MRCSARLLPGVTAERQSQITPASAVIWQQPVSPTFIFPERIAELALSLGTLQSELQNGLAPAWLRSSSSADLRGGVATRSDATTSTRPPSPRAGLVSLYQFWQPHHNLRHRSHHSSP